MTDESKQIGKLYKVWRTETYQVPYTVWAYTPEEALAYAEEGSWEDCDLDNAVFVDAGSYELEEEEDAD